MFSKLKNNKFIQFSYSLKLTVICLIVLAVLTIWGTIYQADNGLYAAKAKFFTSWIFFGFGFIPLPGGALTLTVLFFNLVSSMIFRIGFRMKNIGNILTHLGMLILLVGGFFTFLFSQESVLMLKEGEKSAWSSSYQNWELAVWADQGGIRHYSVIDFRDIETGKSLEFSDFDINITVKKAFLNSSAFRNRGGNPDRDILNASGIVSIDEKQPELEPEANIPAVLLRSGDLGQDIILYGGEMNPTHVDIKGGHYNFQLRKLRHKLPIELGLIDFRIRRYPGSEIVKSYESSVEIRHEGLRRELVISMNKPLRFEDFTFFQSSYQITPEGVEYSVFAVVKNAGRLLPYISSIVVFLGLLVHFIMMMLRRKRENTDKREGK